MLPQINWESGGILGLLLAFLLVWLDKQFNFMGKILKRPDSPKKDSTEQLTVAVNALNTTQTELLNFLRTESLVNKEKASQQQDEIKSIRHNQDTILNKLDNLNLIITTHNTECKQCYK